jgi:ATP-dependent Zn protease
MTPELIVIIVFSFLILVILILNRYKKESRHSYYNQIRWEFDSKDAETVDMVEVTKAENQVEEEPEEEEEKTRSLNPFGFLMGIVMVGMLLGVGMVILHKSLFPLKIQIFQSATISSAVINSTQRGISSLNTISDFFPMIIGVFVFTTLISMFLKVFRM